MKLSPLLKQLLYIYHMAIL